MSYARDYTLSVLSQQAYSDSPQSRAGYNVLATFNDPGTGFFAVAYVRSGDPSDIVIAFRGTNGSFFAGDPDWAANAAIGNPAPAWHAQFEQAINFTNSVRLAHPSADIMVTGHSLGGALAQATAHMFNLTGAAFDPGGALNIVQSGQYASLATTLNTAHPGSNPPFGSGAESSFRNYLIEDSIVSGWSGDNVNSGNQETLSFFAYAQGEEIVVEAATQIASFALSGFGLGFLANVTTSFLTTYVFHGIDGIVSLMSVRANGQFDAGSALYQRINQTVSYLNTTGNVGFDDISPSTVVPTYTLTSYNNRLIADNGNNEIIGTPGNDVIFAMGGNDVINAGLGNDTVDGGAGVDAVIAQWSSMSTSVIWNLQTGSYTGPGRWSNVEYFASLNLGSGNDQIVTSSSAYDDYVFLGDGDDEFLTRNGSDYVNGGGGINTLVLEYSDASTAASIYSNLTGAGNAFVSATRQLQFMGIAHFDIRTGSGNDNITTHYGNDIVNSGAGNDQIDAGGGDNIINAGDGDDLINVRGGDNTVNGGSGIDGVITQWAAISEAISWDLQTESYIGPGSWANVEYFASLNMGSGNDDISTSASAYDDYVYLGDGNDQFLTRNGSDYVNGGGGINTLVLEYSDATAAANLYSNLTGAGNAFVATTRQLQFIGIAHFDIRTGSGNDNITTHYGNDIINSAGGDDQIDAGGGDNVIDTGDGDDLVSVRGGNNVVDGGSGVDGVITQWAAVSEAISWDLQTESYSGPGSWVNVEYFSSLNMGSGNDDISTSALAYNDFVFLGDGDDQFLTRNGSDYAHGGSGINTLVLEYSDATTAVNFYSNLTGAGSAYVSVSRQLQFVSMAHFHIWTGMGDDNVTTHYGNDIIYSGMGNDQIDVSGGDDVVFGGAGNDIIHGGSGISTFWGESGNDRLILGSYADGSSLDGGTGNDILVINSAIASLSNLASIEAIELAGNANLTLTSTQFTTGLAQNTSVTGTGTLTINMDASGSFISKLITFIGTGVSLVINGSTGDDIFKLGNASHTINAGDGTDQIKGGAAADTINGGAGVDKINGAAGADILTGGTGNDVFKYAAVIDSGLGAAADRITDFAIGGDRLNFALIDANAGIAGDQAFAFVGMGAFSGGGVGSIRYANSGSDLLVQVDVDGNGTADMEIILEGLAGQTLAGGNFNLGATADGPSKTADEMPDVMDVLNGSKAAATPAVSIEVAPSAFDAAQGGLFAESSTELHGLIRYYKDNNVMMGPLLII